MKVKIEIINNVYGSNDRLLLEKDKIYTAHYKAKRVTYNAGNMYTLMVEDYRILKTHWFTKLCSSYRYFRSLP